MPSTDPLRYAIDVTLADVDAVTAFVMSRLIHHRLNVDTEEYRTNAALRRVVPAFAGTLDPVAHSG
ncbi:hypothetical protein [Kitasatospora sp. NPDC056531]|uniref:hypothetical protein n=1 Tax=Kitasatospora sp. NPDC056531 TaxID=3345856 RepID=UPI0036974ACA